MASEGQVQTLVLVQPSLCQSDKHHSLPPILQKPECQITEITTLDKGDSNIVIVDGDGAKTSQIIPAGLTLVVKQGDSVKSEQALNLDPNVGGFGQEESEIVLQNPIRIIGYLAFCLCVLLTQIFLVLKKKQFEKVQAAELNF